MKGLLLDTHVWLWHLSGSDRLPSTLRSKIERSSKHCWVSPITVWEAGLLHQRDRIRIRGDYRKWLRDARAYLPWREAVINAEVALSSLELDLPQRDPADRIIAATALVYQLEVATLDATLIAARWLPTVSE